MKRTLLRTLLIFTITQASLVFAQDAPPAPGVAAQTNPLSAHTRMLYQGAQKILLRTAETMPEANYAFKPADTVRTFGQIIGHVADAQYLFCSAVRGEKNPALKIEKTVSSKVNLIAALKESFAYCNKAYDALTDATASQSLPFMGSDMPRLGVLTINQVHTIEHYGNLVTYLRIKNIVPPTSEPEFMKSLRSE